MDPLRQPIGDSTRSATWLPEGIGLEERELDWLRNMGDWMITKKRYYGLALPIYECTECDGWEVIGSKEELQERAVGGLGRVRGSLAASAVGRRGARSRARHAAASRVVRPTSATRGSTPGSWRSRP